MVEHRSHSAGLEYDASAGWKLRKLGRDIRRRRRHLRLVDDSAVSSHDANLRFRHRHVQPGKILHVDSPLPRQSRSYRLLQKSRDHYPMLNKSVLNDRVSERWWSGRAIARLLPQPAGIGIGIGIS